MIGSKSIQYWTPKLCACGCGRLVSRVEIDQSVGMGYGHRWLALHAPECRDAVVDMLARRAARCEA